MKRLQGKGLHRAVSIVLMSQLAACYSWRARSVDQQRRMSSSQTLRLALSGGEEILVEDAIVVGDSVVGVSREEKRRDRLAVPLSQVRDIHMRQFDATETGFLIAGIGIPIIAVIGLTTANTCGAGGTVSC
jgi:hypothetical protein